MSLPIDDCFHKQINPIDKLGVSTTPLQTPSLFQTSFYKGSFGLPQIAQKDTFLTAPKTSLHSTKNSLFMTYSTLNSSGFKLPESVLNESVRIPEKDVNKTIEAPKKLKKILKTTTPMKESLSVIKAQAEAKQSTMQAYLDYLGSDPYREKETSFSIKMHNRFNKTLGHKIEPLEIPKPKAWSDQIKSADNLRLHSSKETTSSLMDVRYNSSGLEPESASPSNSSRSKFRDSYKGTNKRQAILQEEGKTDEAVARELSEDVAKNYKAFLITAALNKDLKVRIAKMLHQENVAAMFNTKGSKISLQKKVHDDLLEIVQDEDIPVRVSLAKPRYNSILKTKSTSDTVPRVRIIARLIPLKYYAYKRINSELIEAVTQFKLQEVDYIESQLSNAHEIYIKRRDDVLKHMSLLYPEKYEELKNRCQSMEGLLSVYASYDLEENSATAKPDKEWTLVNRNIGDVMKRWRDHITIHNKKEQ